MEGVDSLSFTVAYMGGLVSFFSPCLIPLLPSYFSIMTGFTFKEMYGLQENYVRTRMFFSSILFVIGFSLVYSVLGATGSFIGKFILTQSTLLIRISGIVLIILGLIQLGIINFHGIQYDYAWNIQKRLAHLGYATAFLTGIVCAFIWMPCVGQILGAILLIASKTETAVNGFMLLLVFSLGIGTPFLFLGLFFPYLFPLLQRKRSVFLVINKAAGILLLVFGIILVFNQYQFFLSFFQQIVPLFEPGSSQTN